MEELGNVWGASRDLNSLSFNISEEEVREAFSDCFRSLAWKITSKGGPGGDWDGKYVNAIPVSIEIVVHKSNVFRKLVIKCRGDANSLDIFR